MGILRVDHPDIREFIEAKLDGQSFRNFNLSVGATDEFMKAAAENRSFALHHPRSGQTTGSIAANELFAEMAQAAWRTGDPGLIFLDAINRANPTPEIGAIEATNPCGEVPLLSFEACNLASINLSHMVRQEGTEFVVAWEKLAGLVRLTIRFLDNVIDASRWPVPETAEVARANRKVGLGVMGFAEMLILLGISYDSDQAVTVAQELMQFMAEKARAASEHLATERGVFPNWPKSVYARQGGRPVRLRNATCTSIAPTGTLSIIAGTSAGIEPLFALAYRRHVLDGQTLVDVNPLFVRHARQQGFYSDRLMQQLEERGSLTGLPNVPTSAQALFPTALEIEPEAHLRIQAAFQKHVDNAVSKTINLPQSATPADIAAIYRQAWEMGLKGITVFRYGSKGHQVLELGSEETPEEHEHFVKCDPKSCRL
jgi:ribonucleoside-diphosphate reductase alpha chain